MITRSAEPMARKAKGKDPRPEPEPRPRQRKAKDVEPRPIALTIRGREEWKGWVKRLAEFERVAVNELVDRALVRHAREVGFKEQAPER